MAVPPVSVSGGSQSGSSQTFSAGRPIDAGGGAFTSVLNQALGLPQYMSGGQIRMGSIDQLTSPMTLREAEEQLKAYTSKGERKRKGSKWVQQQLDQIIQADTDRLRAQASEIDPLTGDAATLADNLLGDIEREGPFQAGFIQDVENVRESQRNIFDLSSKSLAGLIQDGRPVDVQALVDRGVTDLKEQFGGQGLTYSSDVRSGAVRAGAEMRAVSQENALARQMGALQLGQTHGQSGLQFNSMIGNLGAQYERQMTPEGRSRTRLGMLAGQQPTDISSIGSNTQAFSNSSQSGWNFGLGNV